MQQNIVRCSKGHLFTTIWIPMVSFKAIRWGSSRYQRCPVCHHGRWVERVDESQLSTQDRLNAQALLDTRIP